MIKHVLAAAVFAGLWAPAAFAQGCGGQYVVQPGDTLSRIAASLYDDGGLWSEIHRRNIQLIGEDPNGLRVGQKLDIACIDGLPLGLPGGVSQGPAIELPKVKLVTGDDFVPFTDRGLADGGLMAALVDAVMDQVVGPEGYEILWVNDWTSHPDPMLTSQVMDIAFPRIRPDCEARPDQKACADFVYTDPLFEFLTLLYVDRARPILFNSDEDLAGHTLCRPAGHSAHMLDQDGRNLLSGGAVTLLQPRSVETCFALLQEGTVDGIVLNEFTGRAMLRALDLAEVIEPVKGRPVAITTLHGMVARSHPLSEELILAFNRGLFDIRATGRFGEVMHSHMQRIWAGL